MNTFYTTNLTDIVQLEEQESNHAIKVLRLKPNSVVRLIDGKGGVGVGKILDNHPKRCSVQVTDKKQYEAGLKVAIAIAPTKTNDRIEWFLEKATEIGVTDFYPILTKNSERKNINLDRWNKVVLAATKQSLRPWMPIVHDLAELKQFITENNFTKKCIAHCFDENKNTLTKQSKDTLLLIGPEGDFTMEEVQLAIQNGFDPVTLGDNRLRTETAGVVAATILCV